MTGFNDAYFARKNESFDHGHVVVGTFEVNYEKYEGFDSRAALSFPNLPPNQWYMIDMFPGMNFNLRGSALRCDIVTPLGPDKVMIEFRGLGLKSDTAEERQKKKFPKIMEKDETDRSAEENAKVKAVAAELDDDVLKAKYAKPGNVFAVVATFSTSTPSTALPTITAACAIRWSA